MDDGIDKLFTVTLQEIIIDEKIAEKIFMNI